MTQTEALRLALEALTVLLDEWTPARQAQLKGMEAVTAIKAALEAKDEPVAWRWMPAPYWKQWVYSDDSDRVEEAKRFMGDGGVQPLYTTPPQRTWVGLTDEEIWACLPKDPDEMVFARAIEVKLSSKNYGS